MNINEYIICIKDKKTPEVFRAYAHNKSDAIINFIGLCKKYTKTNNEKYRKYWNKLYTAIKNDNYTIIKNEDFHGIRKL